MITHSPGDKIPSSEWNANFAGLADGSLDLQGNSLSYFRRKTTANIVLNAGVGFLVPVAASLVASIPAGLAYVNGKYQDVATLIHAWPASKDSYLDLLDDGTFLYPNVANGAAAPALSLNADLTDAMRLGKIVTDATTITAVQFGGIDSIGNVMYNGSPFGVNKVFFPSYLNSWVDFDTTTFGRVYYYKDRAGQVHLHGLIKNGSGLSVPAFNLPAGFRPSLRILAATYSAGSFGRLDILPNGDVQPTSGSTSDFSLNVASFQAVN